MKDDDVKEALKRLPEHLYNERVFRIKRALDLSLKHQILPKDQWVKYEEVRAWSVSKVHVLNGSARAAGWEFHFLRGHMFTCSLQ
uniref:Cytochrome b-c1 complex subunit 7 n=1 Tax=Cyanistes caeruleus TaxID=156563 RepID=A0A8C0U9Y4_CYACU